MMNARVETTFYDCAENTMSVGGLSGDGDDNNYISLLVRSQSSGDRFVFLELDGEGIDLLISWLDEVKGILGND